MYPGHWLSVAVAIGNCVASSTRSLAQSVAIATAARFSPASPNSPVRQCGGGGDLSRVQTNLLAIAGGFRLNGQGSKAAPE